MTEKKRIPQIPLLERNQGKLLIICTVIMFILVQAAANYDKEVLGISHDSILLIVLTSGLGGLILSIIVLAVGEHLTRKRGVT